MKYSIILITFLLFSCQLKEVAFGNVALSQKTKLTNMQTLHANPIDFDNDTLKIIGELHLDLENKAIVTKHGSIWIESWKPATQLDSVWNSMNRKKVEIIGLYKAGQTGHLNLYNGQLKEVYYIKTE